jgi:hypothetical protein
MISPYSLSSENLKSSQNDLYGRNHKAKEPHHWGLSKNVILPTQWCVKNSILKNGWFWGQGIPRPTSSCHQGGSVKHAGALSDGFEIQVIPSWTKNHFSGSAKTKKRIRVFQSSASTFFHGIGPSLDCCSHTSCQSMPLQGWDVLKKRAQTRGLRIQWNGEGLRNGGARWRNLMIQPWFMQWIDPRFSSTKESAKRI